MTYSILARSHDDKFDKFREIRNFKNKKNSQLPPVISFRASTALTSRRGDVVTTTKHKIQFRDEYTLSTGVRGVEKGVQNVVTWSDTGQKESPSGTNSGTIALPPNRDGHNKGGEWA